jgi:hypothetical protein
MQEDMTVWINFLEFENLQKAKGRWDFGSWAGHQMHFKAVKHCKSLY